MSLEECGNCYLLLTNIDFFFINLILTMPNFSHAICEWPPGKCLTVFNMS